MAATATNKLATSSDSLRDLPWLAARLFRTAPLPVAGWALLTLISAGLAAVSLWAMRGAVNALTGYGGQPALLPWLVGLGAVFALEQGATVLQPYLRERVRVMAGFALHEAALRKMGRLPVAAFDVESTHDLTRRVAEGADQRVLVLLEDAMSVMELLPVVMANALVLALVSPWLPLLAALVEALLLWYNLRLGARAREFEVINTRQRRLADYYAGVLTGRSHAAEVRLWGLQGELLGRWHSTLSRYLSDKLQVTLKNSLLGASGSIGFVVLIALATSAVALFAGRVEPGVAALVVTSLRSVTAGMNMLLGVTQRFIGQAGYASDLRRLIEAEPEESPTAGHDTVPFPRPLRQEIRVEGLRYRYPGAAKDSLSDVSFAIKAGEIVALVGANGAGKTTLASILLGLRAPTAGQVTVDGVDFGRMSLPAIQRACTAVFQQPVRFPASVAENMAFDAAGTGGDRLSQVRAKVGADRAALEPGALLGPEFGGVDLSGGEWQRLAIARSLYRSDAQVVVFDEPTAALDPLAELALFEQMAALAAGRTLILVSHRLGPTRMADRVLVLDGGRLIEEGPPASLLAAGGRFAQMFEAQAQWYR